MHEVDIKTSPAMRMHRLTLLIHRLALLMHLTFPVKSLLQAANPHKNRAILTSLATLPGYQ
ncbi:hypothetical protein [uncultured Nostoc sp.]|uniref:hypothetical protein n=1 Tax=uncultured Nostoc sp. TaxID=340711 RepID=UPI0035CC09B8